MSSETNNLTQALKGKSQTQGAWGEMILQTILRESGLREGVEYVFQESRNDEEGSRLRPDVVVNLPSGEKVVIDGIDKLQQGTKVNTRIVGAGGKQGDKTS